jgi:excisionase family DNA binding protein
MSASQPIARNPRFLRAGVTRHIPGIQEMTTTSKASHALPRLFTIAQVAEYLNVSQRTVRRMVKTRVLPVVRIGRSIRVSESALARLVTS